ncbi:unnamed protein product [Trichobilharzia regenti]|nr:unnamed protein product [Trichobilharzia regenti]
MFVDEYEKEKSLNNSTPLVEENELLIVEVEKKWKARARLDVAEDAYLKSLKSSETCLKKEVNDHDSLHTFSEAADDRLSDAAAALDKYLINRISTDKKLLRDNTQRAEKQYGKDTDALVNKIVEVERQRFQYLQCKSI